MKSFYHYLMKFRHPKPKDEISHFANAAYEDHSFPKASTDYHELCAYLELNGDYLSSMTTFDEAFEQYEVEVKKNNTQPLIRMEKRFFMRNKMAFCMVWLPMQNSLRRHTIR